MDDPIRGQISLEPDVAARRRSVASLAVGAMALLAGSAVTGRAQAQAQGLGPGCVQEGWRWCNKCQGMFYGLASAGVGGLGHCPAGGAHTTAGSGFYYQRIGSDVANVQQGGWSWCNKCMGFFYSRASSGMGRCAAGGAHTKAGSGAYAAVLGETSTGRQGGWRWCGKCMGMFYSQASAGLGVCPAGGAHITSGSGHYACLN
jgi:hypothetical protein